MILIVSSCDTHGAALFKKYFLADFTDLHGWIDEAIPCNLLR